MTIKGAFTYIKQIQGIYEGNGSTWFPSQQAWDIEEPPKREYENFISSIQCHNVTTLHDSLLLPIFQCQGSQFESKYPNLLSLLHRNTLNLLISV